MHVYVSIFRYSDSGLFAQTPTGDLPQEPLDGGFPSPGLLAIRKVKVISFPSLHVAHWAALISVLIAPRTRIRG